MGTTEAKRKRKNMASALTFRAQARDFRQPFTTTDHSASCLRSPLTIYEQTKDSGKLTLKSEGLLSGYSGLLGSEASSSALCQKETF